MIFFSYTNYVKLRVCVYVISMSVRYFLFFDWMINPAVKLTRANHIRRISYFMSIRMSPVVMSRVRLTYSESVRSHIFPLSAEVNRTPDPVNHCIT